MDITKKKRQINDEIISNFKRHFGDMQVSLYSAPGRSELGGNHTDHQNGQVR